MVELLPRSNRGQCTPRLYFELKFEDALEKFYRFAGLTFLIQTIVWQNLRNQLSGRAKLEFLHIKPELAHPFSLVVDDGQGGELLERRPQLGIRSMAGLLSGLLIQSWLARQQKPPRGHPCALQKNVTAIAWVRRLLVRKARARTKATIGTVKGASTCTGTTAM